MIRQAVKSDIPAISAIYEDIHSAEEAGHISTGWLRGIYPTEQTADKSLERGDMFVLEREGEVLAAAIINSTEGDAYAGGDWSIPAERGEAAVLHTLAVHPKAAREGLGREFVGFYENFARQNGFKVLRLDTNEKNAAARAMYKALGYREAGTVLCEFNGIPSVRLVLLEKEI